MDLQKNTFYYSLSSLLSITHSGISLKKKKQTWMCMVYVSNGCPWVSAEELGKILNGLVLDIILWASSDKGLWF